jgi:hypothetical protein
MTDLNFHLLNHQGVSFVEPPIQKQEVPVQPKAKEDNGTNLLISTLFRGDAKHRHESRVIVPGLPTTNDYSVIMK